MTALAEAASGTPLLSLSAVSFDTETTGLDVRTCRVVQIGAVRIATGRLARSEAFETLVDPGEPIPSASTKIHKIADADVDGAPPFADCLAAFDAWARGSMLIGYSTGFDLAVLLAEARRAGVVWHPPRSLDVRHLVRLLAPPLPDHALETVAAWLGLEIDRRHDAVADAVLTARVFLKLVPLLRAHGIWTLGEAEAACRRLSAHLADEVAAGWHGAERAAPNDRVAALARVDSFPYRHRIADVMTGPPIAVKGETSIRDVLTTMMKNRISSVFVYPQDGEDADGIITERDILRALDADPEGALTRHAGTLATRPLISVSSEEHVYRAITRMQMARLRHLAVRDGTGMLVGAVTARDLLRQRAGDALSLGDELEHATTPEDLGLVWAKLSIIALALNREGVDPRDIAAIISNELRALTRQACIIAERELLDAGRGTPPIPYAMMVLGSGGRGESLLAMDQDNAIVFEDENAGGQADTWLAALGGRVADILDAAGVAYCRGGIMAANAEWRMSVRAWRCAIGGWIVRSRPTDILNTDIFFDSVPVFGDTALADTIRNEGLETAAGSKNFLHLLAHNAANVEVPLRWFGRLRLKAGRVDLKSGGLLPIFSAARVLALRHGIAARSTPQRLREARRFMPADGHIIDRLSDAHRTLLGAILEQQLRDIERGIPVSNSISPREVSAAGLDTLKWALEQVRDVKLLLGNPLVLE